MFEKYKNQNIGLLFLRLGVGIVFLNHGLMKYNTMGFTVRFFESLHLPAFMAYFVTGVEIVGASLMILGLFVEIAGVALAIDMATAMYLTNWTRGFTPHELEFLLALMALTVTFAGAGQYAIRFKKISPDTTPDEFTT